MRTSDARGGGREQNKTRQASNRSAPPRTHLTPFVGRRALLDACREALKSDKLVTLYGAGGEGKTRLMEELARELTGDDGEGPAVVYLENLAADDDERQVAATIAESLDLLDNDGTPSLARLVTHLRQRHVTLMLDNCEHLVGSTGDGPVPRVLRTLLQTSQNLRVVATSRERLGIQGEQQIRVPGLSLGDQPDPDAAAADGTMYEALEVLIDRAKRAGTKISPHDPVAHRLCQLLEGLPLALELAAGRMDTLSPARILAAIQKERGLVVLVGGDSDREQHRTMLATIQASYKRLTPGAQRICALLSVFPGGADLDAASAVCAKMGIDEWDVPLLLSELVQRSVVKAEVRGRTHRYRLPPLMREWGLRVLKDCGEDYAAQLAHAQYIAALHKRGAVDWFSPREGEWMRRLGLDAPSSRAATRFLLGTGDPKLIALAQDMEAASASSRWRIFDGKLQEMLRMLGSCIEHHPDAPTERLVTLLAISGWVAMIQGQPGQARPLLDRAEAAARVVGCEKNAALQHASATWSWMSDSQAAWTPTTFETVVLPLLDQVERAFGEVGSKGDRHMAKMFTGIAAAFLAGREVAMARTRDVLEDAKAAGAEWAISWGWWVLALAEIRHAGPAKAMRSAMQGLRLQRKLGELWGLAWMVWLIFVILVEAGEYALAGQVFGGARSQLKLTSANVEGLAQHRHVQTRAVAKAIKGIGQYEWETEVAVGEGWSRKQLLDLVERAATLVADDGRPGDFPAGLTAREYEVTGLVVQGLANKDIAARLTLSPRTIETHVSNILTKIGVANRGELAEWWPTRGEATAGA